MGLEGSPLSWQPVPKLKRGQDLQTTASCAAREFERAWDTRATSGFARVGSDRRLLLFARASARSRRRCCAALIPLRPSR